MNAQYPGASKTSTLPVKVHNVKFFMAMEMAKPERL